MRLKSIFKHSQQRQAEDAYDRELLEPVIRASICTGEKTVGFLNRQTGRFEEISLIRTEEDLDAFKSRYGISGDIRKIY